MGHSGEEIEVTIGGETKTLNEALSNNNVMTFEFKNPDITTYECKTLNLKDYCGDEDGCTMRLNLQNEIDVNDQVRVIEETIYMEQDDMSNDNGAGTYGWTRQQGGGDALWITGITGIYTIFDAWGLAWMFNYNHDFCPGQSGSGPAHTDPYNFTIMIHPHISAKVFVYD